MPKFVNKLKEKTLPCLQDAKGFREGTSYNKTFKFRKKGTNIEYTNNVKRRRYEAKNDRGTHFSLGSDNLPMHSISKEDFHSEKRYEEIKLNHPSVYESMSA